MATPVSTFKTGLQIAIEQAEAIAPGLSSNPMWWQGGRWFDITTDGLPTGGDQQATIFPAGHAGRRAMNTRAPVVGRRWSEFSFNAPVTQDFMVPVLYGALGSLSHNATPSTDFELLADEPLDSGASKALVLATQPSDGGAILRFTITEASAGGTISVSGIDAYGNGASEVISFSSAGSFYTRTSFSAIGPSSIVIDGNNGASVSIHGFQYWTYTFDFNNTSNPRLSILRHGDPTAGAGSINRYHPAMVVTQLTITNPAEARDGLFTMGMEFEGYPTATCAAGSLNATSAQRVWPSWTQKLTKNGVDWFKVVNFSTEVATGNRNYRAAAGTQNPQGQVFLAQEVTGAFEIYVTDEEEYLEWQGASKIELTSQWTSPWKLTSSQNMRLTGSFNSLYLEGFDQTDNDGVLAMSADFRSVENADTGLARFELICGVPPASVEI